MKYLDVCSGISAPTAAWKPLGWECAGFSEIEKFPSAVLAHHYPDIPNYGDMTQYERWPHETDIDVLVGGTPCQSFSVAGLRKGLADPRGNLALVYLGIADRYRPPWIVWENVPGVLSSNGGRDFGAFLGALVKLGYGFAYRVLDAQFFGVPQRRRRVFVVGYLGDWRPAAAVLFDAESLRGNPPPRREARESITHDVAPSLTGSGRGVERTGESRGQDPITSDVAFPIGRNEGRESAVMHPIAFKAGQGAKAGSLAIAPLSPTLGAADSGTNRTPAICADMRVRRLTPLECERLQGFPDDYTFIPWKSGYPGASPGIDETENEWRRKLELWERRPFKPAPDGPRYKALGNSMAVPVVRWIGKRIKAASELAAEMEGRSCNSE